MSNYIQTFKKNVKRYFREYDLNDFTPDQLDNCMNYYLKNHRVTTERYCAIEFYEWLYVPFVQDILFKLGIIDHVTYREV